MNDKRNPNLSIGNGEDVESYLGRIAEHISKLEWQSDGHRMWYTHKNPFGCWICELLQVVRQLQDICMDNRDNDGTDAEEPING